MNKERENVLHIELRLVEMKYQIVFFDHLYIVWYSTDNQLDYLEAIDRS